MIDNLHKGVRLNDHTQCRMTEQVPTQDIACFTNKTYNNEQQLKDCLFSAIPIFFSFIPQKVEKIPRKIWGYFRCKI
jgi:hypothetical protein